MAIKRERYEDCQSLKEQSDFENAAGDFNKGLCSVDITPTNNKSTWPISFKDCTGFGRGVSVATITDWIGRMREICVRASLPNITPKFLSGEFGWITHGVDMSISQIPQNGYIAHCDYKVKLVTGVVDGTLDHYFIWSYSKYVNGPKTEFCVSKVRTRWVKVIGYGQVEAQPFPEDVRECIKSYFENNITYEINDKKSLELLGQVITTGYPDKRGFLPLMEKTVETTMQDSNVVGNIYYSNYTKWLAQTTDLFFYKVFPDLRTGTESGEPVASYNSIVFLREVMPFDTVIVKMSLRSLHESGFRFAFEFFKLNGVEREKVAFSFCDFVWSKTGVEIEPLALPQSIKSKLLDSVQEFKFTV